MMKGYCEIISPVKSRELRQQEEPGGELNKENFQEQDPVRLKKRPYRCSVNDLSAYRELSGKTAHLVRIYEIVYW